MSSVREQVKTNKKMNISNHKYGGLMEDPGGQIFH
jgi:hypothetical protein